MKRSQAGLAPLALVLGLLTLSALACSVSIGETETPEPPQAVVAPPTVETLEVPEPVSLPPPDVIYGGISFSYAEWLAADVTPQTIPAGPDEDMPGGDLLLPEYVRFDFVGYILPGTFHEPHLLVYPVADYEAANEIAAGVIAEHRQFMSARPPAPESIPFLPLWNAAQAMRTQVAYLDFQNGTGVRFLTQYGQAANPINNQELFYTFQGMTHDGAHYVVAILPVSHPTLPADGMEIPGGDYETFANNYATYARDVEQQLAAQPPSSFRPDLSGLDALIQSLSAE